MRISAPPGSRAALEFRAVTQSVAEAIVVSDSEGKIIFWNEGAETIFGYAEKAILGKPLTLLIPIQPSTLRLGKLDQLLFSKASPIDGKTHELRGIHADGHRFPVELSLLTWSFGTKIFFTTIIRDITERKRLQKEILEISGREQQRIGQDLHDDLCQQLSGITLLTKVLEDRLFEESSARAADAAEIHKLIGKAVVYTRLLSKGLLPVEFEEGGLATALKNMASSTAELSHIHCHFKETKPILIQDGSVAVHLFRIAQEAVTNAVKHAGAKNIAIKLCEQGGHVILSIADDGIGIADGPVRNGGLGLSIMNSRAETINATLEIRKGEHRGTIITCSLRLRESPTNRRVTDKSKGRNNRNPIHEP